MIYPVRLVKALPLVFSVGADHDSVRFVRDVVPLEEREPLEEPEPLVAPLDELLELLVGATGRGRHSPRWPALRMEAIGALPVPVVETSARLLASVAEPALGVEPPHPDSRTTEVAIAPRMWALSFRRRSIFMCIRLAIGSKAQKALWRLRIDRKDAD